MEVNRGYCNILGGCAANDRTSGLLLKTILLTSWDAHGSSSGLFRWSVLLNLNKPAWCNIKKVINSGPPKIICTFRARTGNIVLRFSNVQPIRTINSLVNGYRPWMIYGRICDYYVWIIILIPTMPEAFAFVILTPPRIKNVNILMKLAYIISFYPCVMNVIVLSWTYIHLWIPAKQQLCYHRKKCDDKGNELSTTDNRESLHKLPIRLV